MTHVLSLSLALSLCAEREAGAEPDQQERGQGGMVNNERTHTTEVELYLCVLCGAFKETAARSFQQIFVAKGSGGPLSREVSGWEDPNGSFWERK